MTPHARKGAALLYYQRQIIFPIQSESHAQSELVDFRLPGRQHPRQNMQRGGSQRGQITAGTLRVGMVVGGNEACQQSNSFASTDSDWRKLILAQT